MGCTPSIHVSQTGVVYCQDSDEASSPHVSLGAHGGASGAATTTTVQGGVASGHHITTTVTTTTVVGGRAARKAIAGGVLTEAETQTKLSLNMKVDNTWATLGPMRVHQHPMSILLVFAREDAQSDGFWWAADRGGYKCNIVRTAEAALEFYLDKRHDVVIIDARSNKNFDSEALCRSIRKANDATVIVAVTKKNASDKVSKEETGVLALLNAGFNRRIVENPAISACLNELYCLEHNDVRMAVQLRAAMAWLSALEQSADAVEVTNEDHVVQYVNPAHERLFGYTLEDLMGRNKWELMPGDKLKPNMQETMNSRLRKGDPWEGVFQTRRKGGDVIQHHCKISPVPGQGGVIRHFVSLKNTIPDGSQSLEKYTPEYNQISNGGIHTYPVHRRASMARMQSMSIEAPITKVINMISAAQENSPVTVVTALDKVLEILQSSELYSPYFGQQVKQDDQMTNDLVGGLMATSREHSFDIQTARSGKTSSTNLRRRLSDATHHTLREPKIHTTPSLSTRIANMPANIVACLDNEDKWTFDIIELERLTNKQTLLYCGLKTFQRFGVMDYLRCPEDVMVNWLQTMEANYHADNSYHNSTHATDVMQATAYFLGKERMKNIMEQSDEVVSLIAAIIHDLDHPGKTNSFLVNAGDPLALLYNDLAVLESHHAAMAFQLTRKDDRVNIFKNLDKDDLKMLRQQTIDMVLATEMTKHFEHLSKFASSVSSVIKDEEREMSTGSGSPDSGSTMSRLASPENRMLIKRMLIKCSDVANPTRPLHLCKEWASRISEEYFHQTDEEKRLGLPVVMPVFDRNTCNVPKSQTSFTDFFIKDMFDAWDNFCDIPEVIEQLQTNYDYWKNKEDEAAKELEDRKKKAKEDKKKAKNT